MRRPFIGYGPTGNYKVKAYKPGRKDKRIHEAQSFLKAARHLRNMTPNGLACQFNLKPSTAQLLIDQEARKRG